MEPRAVCLAVALLCCLGAAASAYETATERVLDRVDVPDPSRRVGEVRLVARGDAAVVETLLDTKLIKRVVAEIRSKELANWPEGRDGHADSARYVAALEKVGADLRGRQPVHDRTADRRVRLFIDFVLAPDASTVVLGSFDATRQGGTLQVTSRFPMTTLQLPRGWVAANMRLIVADAFHLEGAALDAKLAALPGDSGVRRGSAAVGTPSAAHP